MPLKKRVFDIVLSTVLAVILSPVVLCVALIVWSFSGRPVFYVTERMKTFDEPFKIYKFRTMKPEQGGVRVGVTGGDKRHRISKLGGFLRASRLDELPQLYNIFRGDMSFVGPRPTGREFVERFPDIYREILKDRPGLTSLATMAFHSHEERLLAAASTPEEVDHVYTTRCIPRKARLDLLYRTQGSHARSLCFDIWILFRTVKGRLRAIRPR